MTTMFDRRMFMRGASLVPFVTVARRIAAQPNTGLRTAIVIGVDRPGADGPRPLPALHAAAAAANDVAKWLTDQGFDNVALRTDEGGKTVKADDLYAIVNGYVAHENVKMLVVFFAGHGFVDARDEYWLLSGAPDNPNEMIGLTTCRAGALRQTIPNVVFISDACRSLARDPAFLSATSRSLFPARSTVGNVSVDMFLGARVGGETYEASIEEGAQKYVSLFTRSLLAAYQSPPADCVDVIDHTKVLTNRKLRKYLPGLFQRELENVPHTIRQEPYLDVTSDDLIYIGRIAGDVQAVPPNFCSADAAANVEILAKTTFTGIESGQRLTIPMELREISADVGFSARLEVNGSIQSAEADIHSATGFVVRGADVTGTRAAPGTEIFVERAKDGSTVRVTGDVLAGASLVVRFADGSGALLAILPGYVGTVALDERGVSSVGYLPSRESGNFPGEQQRERVRDLHVAAASAASFGAFRVETREEAEVLGNKIRPFKNIDPTLGLYAAYAFDQAGRADLVRSVADYMRGDLGFLLFDVAMLAFGTPYFAKRDNRTAPLCPMLTQGWAYSDAIRVEFPEPLRRASAYLRRSLWTTFEAKGMDILWGVNIFRRG